jgi:hypothetical protein
VEHTYRSRTFSVEVHQKEDKQWHGYAMFDDGHEPVQVAGIPHKEKSEAYRNAFIAARDYISRA